MAFLLRPVLEQHDELYVLPGGEHGDEVVSLEDEADVLFAEIDELVVAHGVNIMAADFYVTLIGTVEPADDIQKGCLARAGRADDGGEFSFADLQVYAIECFYRDFIRVVYFHDALGGDDFHC